MQRRMIEVKECMCLREFVQLYDIDAYTNILVSCFMPKREHSSIIIIL
jgi:hypothetical protein